jgi:PIN domain nuclease of toxin-antitoxin system
VERAEVTYLDTHIVVWLYEASLEKLSGVAKERLRSDSLLISPAVILELELLHEIHRLTRTSRTIVDSLSADIGLSVCELPFPEVVESAVHQKWVRDPFDRLIVAHANANEAPLITKDETIRRHYRQAVW